MLENWIIGLHLVTAHAGSLPDPGAHRYLATPGAYAVAPGGFTLGAYRNSLSDTPRYPGARWTAYVGWTWRPSLEMGPLRDVAVTAAAASGYVERVSPLIGVSASVGRSDLAPRIMWVPHRTQPISFAIEWRM
jgi:hypothetical protein